MHGNCKKTVWLGGDEVEGLIFFALSVELAHTTLIRFVLLPHPPPSPKEREPICGNIG